MGTEAIIGGLFGLASAGVSAYGAHSAASANAAAQADINEKTMAFNRKEAEKARKFSANQASIDRTYNQKQALVQRSFTAAQAQKLMDFNAQEAAVNRDWTSNENLLTRQFNASEAAKARAFNAQEASTTRAFNAQEAALARKFDAQQSLLARQFEERMSSSAHQREVADLRAAGLNPILSATGGVGASTPVAPIIGGPAASGLAASGPAASAGALGSSAASVGGLGSGSAAMHNGAATVAAMVSGLSAPKKANILGEFINSARESMRLGLEYKRAEIADKEADTKAKLAIIEDKKAVQAIEESVSRVQLNYDQHEINIYKKQGEEALARLYNEKVLSEVQKRNNDKKVSDAMEYNLRKTGDAAAAAAGAQIKLADLKYEIEHAESPERIKNLRRQADMYKSIYDKNEWAITDPKSAAQRKWWRENPEAAHANEFLDILGNVWHGNVSIHGGN